MLLTAMHRTPFSCISQKKKANDVNGSQSSDNSILSVKVIETQRPGQNIQRVFTSINSINYLHRELHELSSNTYTVDPTVSPFTMESGLVAFLYAIQKSLLKYINNQWSKWNQMYSSGILSWLSSNTAGSITSNFFLPIVCTVTCIFYSSNLLVHLDINHSDGFHFKKFFIEFYKFNKDIGDCDLLPPEYDLQFEMVSASLPTKTHNYYNFR